MKTFEENIIARLRLLEREVERLRVGDKAVAITDHGALSGLSDDDHPQYLLTTGKAADSDKLDGVDSTGFVNTTDAQTINGAKTFGTLPTLPTTTPTDNQAVRKGYADTAYLLNSGWQSYTPTWTAATTNPSIGNGTLSGRYIQIGKLVYCQFRMLAGSTTTFGVGNWRFGYPVAPNTSNAALYQVGNIQAYDYGTMFHIGVTQYAGVTYMGLIINGNWVSGSAPFTWTNGDVLEVNVIYEAA